MMTAEQMDEFFKSSSEKYKEYKIEIQKLKERLQTAVEALQKYTNPKDYEDRGLGVMVDETIALQALEKIKGSK